MKTVDYVVAGLGALGSATCMELARRGHRVIGLERFELGHSRGASHDTSRILRHSYHTPSYVRLTQQAYDDWARLEDDAGTQLVTKVGGLDLFPPDAAIPPIDYTTSLDEVGIRYDVLDPAAVTERWPQFRLPEGTLALHQEDAAIVPAGRGTRVMQDLARRYGADLRDHTPVRSVRDLGDGGIELQTPEGVLRCGGLVVTADAWANDVLASLGVTIPLEVTLEQVTYFQPERPDDFAPGTAAAVDLDGRPVVLRLPLLRRADREGGAGLRRARRRPRAPHLRARRRDGGVAGRPHAAAASRQRPARCARCAASTPSPPTATSSSPPCRGTSRSSSGSARRTASSSRRRSAGCSRTSSRRGGRRPTSRHTGWTGRR